MKKKRIGRRPRLTESLLQQIRADWITGRESGLRLPTEERLSKQYAANPKTIRTALRELEKNRLILRKPFGGSYVAPAVEKVWKGLIGKFVGLSFMHYYTWRDDAFCRQIFSGIARELSPFGIDIAFSTRNWRLWPKNDTPENHYKHADILGIVMISRQRKGVLESLLQVDKPKLSLDYNVVSQGVDSLCFDNAGAGELLARRLYKLKHRRIVGIFENPQKPTPQRDEAWDERRIGFLKEWKSYKDTFFDSLYLQTRGLNTAVLRELNQLLKKPPLERPTAVFVPENILPEVREIATQNKLKIPSRLTVVGITHAGDDSPLTGIRFDDEQLGRTAVYHLLKRIRDPKWKSKKPVLVRLKGKYVAGKTHAQAWKPKR